MDTVTYPDAQVSAYIVDNFVPARVQLNKREDWPLFRQYHFIWTPSFGFLDRNGSMHHAAAGFLPPREFLSLLRIGKARCLMAWTRSREAAAHLEAAAQAGDTMAAEALWWLGVARFLERRDTPGMWEAWNRLTEQYPDSPWALRVYPME
jgi:hypothetical protein